MKILAFSAAMSATAWAGLADWYLSRLTNLLKWDRSTHSLILSDSLFGVMTMGSHHSVVTVTGAIMHWL